ncbi:MAG: hypothetical protein JWN13_5954 [Betaproteobacteria bacterium]|jgi:uncharacterized membrane protein YdjX (TVP38/TMEM64 family)|nr:hypothetical protein [Betaproteobacteria bacterium]
MNFSQWWKVTSGLPVTDLVWAAVLAACAIVGASIALFVVIPLLAERWKERRIKRVRRNARRQRYVSRTAIPPL